MLSPCIKVCVIDTSSGTCLGCNRTLAEIASWSSLAPAERGRIMAQLDGRRSAAAAGQNRIKP